MMTADRFRAEGYARGYAEGEARGCAEVLLVLLITKFGSLPRHITGVGYDAVGNVEVEQISAWCIRVLAADNVEMVFGVLSAVSAKPHERAALVEQSH